MLRPFDAAGASLVTAADRLFPQLDSLFLAVEMSNRTTTATTHLLRQVLHSRYLLEDVKMPRVIPPRCRPGQTVKKKYPLRALLFATAWELSHVVAMRAARLASFGNQPSEYMSLCKHFYCIRGTMVSFICLSVFRCRSVVVFWCLQPRWYRKMH